jgi:hypothetical protein
MLAMLFLALAPSAARAWCEGGEKLGDSCDGYPEAGCCSQDRATRFWCEKDGDQQALCSSACGATTCGWRCEELSGECITYPVVLGSYQCGMNPALADESGDHPWTCPAICQPQCSGRDCGPDGCGGTCGTCYSDPTSGCPMQCTAAGKCDKACADCQALGWTCGSNCCGGVCGSCQPPSTCQAASHTCTQVAEPAAEQLPEPAPEPGPEPSPEPSPEPEPETVSPPETSAQAEAAMETAGLESVTPLADGECPKGYTWHYGQCMLDHTVYQQEGGGSCAWGDGRAGGSSVVLMLLISLGVFLVLGKRRSCC